MHSKTLLCGAMVLSVGCASVPVQRSLQVPSGLPSVGFTFLEMVDPLTHKPLKGIVWYPPSAEQLQGRAELGPYVLEAERDVAVRAGRFPLVVISHGHAGSRFGHRDLAEHLARAGFVVAAVEHAGDSWNDQSAFGTERAMYGRPAQVSTLIDAVVAHPTLGEHVSAERVGVVGFSAGGYTALTLLGAVPDWNLLGPYCQRHPTDAEICEAAQGKTFAPPTKSLADPRIVAGYVMAPLALVFASPHAFDAVTAPVFLAEAEKDPVLLPDENAAVVGKHLASLGHHEVVSGAGHYVFLAPCSEAMANNAPVLCDDPVGVDRRAVHQLINRQVEQLFRSNLTH